jgi:microcystin-dependent protein
MALVTKGRTFVSGEVVTPTKLNTLVDSATVTQIVDADIAGPITGAGKVSNTATTATSANTASTIVARDASGNFSAGTITAALTGNATTATTLQTARTIAISGDVTGTATSFNGGANISIASAITAGAIVTADISDAQITTAKIADGAVTSAKLNSSVILVPTGAVMPFAMNAAPTGWLAADGTAVSRTLYLALWTALGTTYGAGDGSTTFNLPDLRASFIRGAGTDGVATAGTFGVKQADSVIAHTHSGTTGNDSPDHTHGYALYNANTGNYGAPGGNGPGLYGASTQVSSGGASTRHQHAFTTSSQSPAGATETRPRNIAMLYCIKF